MNTKKEWSTTTNNDEALFNESLLPLQIAFKDAIKALPDDKKMHIGGHLIDSLWDEVYSQTFKPQIVYVGLERQPITWSVVKREKKDKALMTWLKEDREKRSLDADENLNALAMVVHYNCVLPRKRGETVFNQVFRTIHLANSSLIRGVVGDVEDWSHLDSKDPIPVKLPPTVSKVKFACRILDLISNSRKYTLLTKSKKLQKYLDKTTKKYSPIAADRWMLGKNVDWEKEKVAIKFLKNSQGQADFSAYSLKNNSEWFAHRSPKRHTTC